MKPRERTFPIKPLQSPNRREVGTPSYSSKFLGLPTVSRLGSRPPGHASGPPQGLPCLPLGLPGLAMGFPFTGHPLPCSCCGCDPGLPRTPGPAWLRGSRLVLLQGTVPGSPGLLLSLLGMALGLTGLSLGLPEHPGSGSGPRLGSGHDQGLLGLPIASRAWLWASLA